MVLFIKKKPKPKAKINNPVISDIIEDDEVGFAVSRLPLDVRENINQGARNNSLHSAGCEIRGMLKEGGKVCHC